MIDPVTTVIGGAVIGIAIGMTGVGGGSLMTPFLVYLGMDLPKAIGTDLIYATITKFNAVIWHHHIKNVHWDIVLLLAIGSIPGSLLTTYVLSSFFHDAGDAYRDILEISLGLMLITTALLLVSNNPLIEKKKKIPLEKSPKFKKYPPKWRTITVGLVVGIWVTLSSVGAGVLGTTALLFMYRFLPAAKIIGTELAHAMPLTFVAGIGHLLFLGGINFAVLPILLLGSIPGVYLGVRLSTIVPQHLLRYTLIVILGFLGVRFIIF